MAIQQKQVNIAKETDDVGALLVGIVKAVKDKKPIAEIAAVELPALIAAMDGMAQIGDEAKADPLAMKQTIALRLAEIEHVLLG